MHKTLLFFFLFVSSTHYAQFHAGAFAGGAGYIGDLNDKPFKRLKPALGLSLSYELSDRVSLRSGLMWGRIEGGDKFSGSSYVKQIRNLSFLSGITEFNLMAELTVFNLYNIRWSPYGFAGIAVYHFNPFVRDPGRKVCLQPLSTEGQGLAGYPDRKPYKLTQFSIPFGGGVKFNVNDNLRLGFEIGLRRLSTDYLDDVSSFYADEADLLNAKGPTAVWYAYRGDEVPGEDAVFPDNGYPVKNAERGNPKTKDWYYFTGFHLTYRLKNAYGKTAASNNKKGLGCPPNVGF